MVNSVLEYSIVSWYFQHRNGVGKHDYLTVSTKSIPKIKGITLFLVPELLVSLWQIIKEQLST